MVHGSLKGGRLHLPKAADCGKRRLREMFNRKGTRSKYLNLSKNTIKL